MVEYIEKYEVRNGSAFKRQGIGIFDAIQPGVLEKIRPQTVRNDLFDVTYAGT